MCAFYGSRMVRYGEFPGAPAVRIGQDSVPRLIVGCTEASKRSLVVRPLRCQGVRGNQRLVGKTPALESSHYPRYQNGSVGCEHMSIEREMADSAGVMDVVARSPRQRESGRLAAGRLPARSASRAATSRSPA